MGVEEATRILPHQQIYTVEKVIPLLLHEQIFMAAKVIQSLLHQQLRKERKERKQEQVRLRIPQHQLDHITCLRVLRKLAKEVKKVQVMRVDCSILRRLM